MSSIQNGKRIKALKQTHYSHSDLKNNGWTDSLIKKFLGDPDETADNPIYKTAAPMRFYLKSRVEEAEKNPAFVEMQQKSQQRSKIAKQVAERKKEELLEWVHSLNIEVADFPNEDKLFRAAVKHYNQHKEQFLFFNPYYFDFVPIKKWQDCEKDFLYRITVNFLRHECSCYEERLEEIYGKVGVNLAYFEIKSKVLESIAKKYPFLEEECKRQLELTFLSCKQGDNVLY